MELVIALGTFLFVTLLVYGFMYKPLTDEAMDSRLGGLRYSRPKREALPDPDVAFRTRVVEPVMRAVTKRVTGLLPSNLELRLESSIT